MDAAVRSDLRLVTWILIAVVVGEGFWVIWSLVDEPRKLIAYLGFVPGGLGTAVGWLLGAIVAAVYVWGTAKFAAVRENLFRPSMLKLLAILAAAMAAILEEVIFRKWIMDFLENRGVAAIFQVLGSGVAFGLAHSVWGLIRQSLDVAVHAMLATTALGAALALVYVLSDRSLAACICAHFLITALIEPGLLLAAVRGQLGLRAAGA